MAQPLTRLGEQEGIFRQTAREFAEDRIRPRVVEMLQATAHPPDLWREPFELGPTGIEVPEIYRADPRELIQVAASELNTIAKSWLG